MSSSLSNLSSVSTLSSTPTGVPWYRATAPPGRAAQLQHSRQASAGQLVSQPSQASQSSSQVSSREESSNTARSSRGSSTSSTDSLASWSSRDTGAHHGGSLASFNTGQSPVTPLSSSYSLVSAGPSKGVSGMQPVELKRVRTLYACVGEHETELSFEPNQIITNGW